MNKKAMLAVADVIEYTDRFNMHAIVTGTSRQAGLAKKISECPTEALWDECGTVGCVWGWTNAWADIETRNGEHVDPVLKAQFGDWDGGEAAAAELGLTSAQSARLFYADGGSIWGEVADEFGWETFETYNGVGVSNWREIKAPQAADVLRRIAKGKLTL